MKYSVTDEFHQVIDYFDTLEQARDFTNLVVKHVEEDEAYTHGSMFIEDENGAIIETI